MYEKSSVSKRICLILSDHGNSGSGGSDGDYGGNSGSSGGGDSSDSCVHVYVCVCMWGVCVCVLYVCMNVKVSVCICVVCMYMHVCVPAYERICCMRIWRPQPYIWSVPGFPSTLFIEIRLFIKLRAH